MKKLILFAIVVLSACSGGRVPSQSVALAPSPALTDDLLGRVARQRVFFGHQSVGYDILNGVADVMRNHPSVQLEVKETKDPAQLKAGVLAHTTVGKNGDPSSKIRSFAEVLDSGVGAKTDVAMVKFCYIDVDDSTDVERVFSEYRTVMTDLSKRHPSVRFLHVTMPLRMVQTGPKAILKKALSKPAGGYVENMRRAKYNDLLRAEYGKTGSVFDLAAIEASGPDGGSTTFTFKGEEYPALNPSYTYDNGHLNETGRRVAAERLLVTLAGSETPR